MLLESHIISAVIGVTGACLVNSAPAGWLFRFGRWSMRIGLFGAIISGIGLFADNSEQLLVSGKFLSNMTIILILLVTEITFPLIKKQPGSVKHAVSFLSWVWIFIVALLNPPYSYWQFIIAYAVILCLTIIYFFDPQKNSADAE